MTETGSVFPAGCSLLAPVQAISFSCWKERFLLLFMAPSRALLLSSCRLKVTLQASTDRQKTCEISQLWSTQYSSESEPSITRLNHSNSHGRWIANQLLASWICCHIYERKHSSPAHTSYRKQHSSLSRGLGTLTFSFSTFISIIWEWAYAPR